MPAFDALAVIAFWSCLAGVVYAYAAYPAVLWMLSTKYGRSRTCPDQDGSEKPFVSIMIAAHNEESCIEARVRNALASEYPADRFEIVVASDGSSDSTAAVVRQFTDPRVRLFDFPARCGKAQVINAVVPFLRGDVIVFSDANTFIDPPALGRFVRWFQNQTIGVVVGRLVLRDAATGRNVDGLYWRYETFLKTHEARLGALLGANGAIYAIRRRVFAPLRRNTLVDDFVLPLLIRLRTGCDTIYDTQVVAHEETPPLMRSEFRRRSRIGAGGWQSLEVLWRLLSPARGWIAFTFLSHKVLRWSGPFFLCGMLLANAALISYPFYQAALGCQGLIYVGCAVGAFVPGANRASRVVRLGALFAGMNLALLVGFWRWASQPQHGAWERTAR